MLIKDRDYYSLYLDESMRRRYSKYSEMSGRIKPFFVIDGFCYWDLISYFLWYSSFYFKKAPGMDVIMSFIDDIEEKVGEGNGLIDLELENEFAEEYLRLTAKICRKKGRRIRDIKNKKRMMLSETLLADKALLRLLLRARISIRYVAGLIRKVSPKNGPKQGRKDVLFLTNIRFLKQDNMQNTMFCNIMRSLEKEGVSYSDLFYEELTQVTNARRILLDFLQADMRYIGDYYNHAVFKSNKKDFLALKKIWLAVKEDPAFKSIFSYKGYDIYEDIKPRLELIFSALSYVGCDARNITKAVLDKDSYKVLVIDHEENLYGKAFMLNTRLNGRKKTVALSHELIYPGCIHTHVKDARALDRKTSLWRPLPDVKCVWGEYSRDVLINYCNYENKLIRITGNPKFDDAKKRSMDKSAILSKCGLDRERKKILIISDGNRAKYDTYLELPRKINGYDFILKPHHYDDEGMLKEKISALSSSASKNFFIMDKYSDVYELIFACDYVMIFTSSVGFEAMMFGKPVIIFDPEKRYMDYLPYMKFKAALKADDARELKRVLESLGEKKVMDTLNRNVRAFVNALSRENDGKASERIADEIVKLLK